MPCVDHQRPEVRELLEDGGGTMLAIEPRRRLDIVAGDGGRRRPDILVFGGLLNEPAFKGRSAEGLVGRRWKCPNLCQPHKCI